MDELRLLGTMLAEPEPSPEAFDRSRHRLRNTMRDVRPAARRRRTDRLAGGLALAAGGVVTAIVIASDPTGSTGSTGSTGKPNGPPVPLTARQVLLAAATTAESQPAGSGTYWHVKRVVTFGGRRQTSETWTTRDGRGWISSKPGTVSKLAKRQKFAVGGVDIGFSQIQQLPTDPATLKAYLVKRSHVQVTEEVKAITSLSDLLYEVPAPSKVRAAAFRALASLPDAKNLGKVPGGQLLRFTYQDGGSNLVVDPKTAAASIEGFTTFGGGKQSMGDNAITSGWTDTLPSKIVPLPTSRPVLRSRG